MGTTYQDIPGARHDLKRKFDGRGETSTITPACECGWVGDPVPAYNDHQLALVQEQEREHIRPSPTASATPEAGR